MKRFKLSMTGFHFVSLGYNSALFGGEKWWKIGNPLPFDVFAWKSDMKKGLDAYYKRNPLIEHGLKNGLVMEEGMGADYYKTFRNNMEAWPTQKGLSAKVKDAAEGIGKIWDHALWDQYAPGLKASGFMTIYAKQLKYLKKAFPKEYEEWAATGFANTFKTKYEALCAQKAAADVNSLWGGMNYELLKISKTSQDWMRAGFLAHDWTMSNWFDLVNGFRG
jgi:hypothetical protein